MTLVRFEEVYESWTKKCLTQEEAAELLGVYARTFRRHIDRSEDHGARRCLVNTGVSGSCRSRIAYLRS